MEVIFNLAAAFIRVTGAMDAQPFLHTLWRKVLLLSSERSWERP
jgi:hypothetical protein